MFNEMKSVPIKYYTKNMVIGAFALLIILAYLFLSPWQNMEAISFPFPMGELPEGVTMPEGMTAPEGMSLPDMPEGFNPPEGFNVPEGFDPPESTGTTATNSTGNFAPPQGMGILAIAMNSQLLVYFAGWVALIMASASAVFHRLNKWATALSFLGGLLALLYYAFFFIQDAIIPIDFLPTVQAGFWLGLMGSLGLVGQVFVPRMRLDDVDAVDVREIVPSSATKRSGLGILQNISVSLDALMANKLRSGLTMLGIVIGVASVVSLISVGRGAQASVTSQIESTGLNQLTVNSGGGGGMPQPGTGAGNSQTLTYSDVEALESDLTDIIAVLPQYSSTLRVRSDLDNVQVSVVGTTDSYASAQELELEIGRYFNENEYNNAARVAILGTDTAQTLFAGVNPLGRYIRIDGSRFEVIGVLAEQDGGFGSNPNEQIYVPLLTGYRNLFNARVVGSSDNYVSSITVVTTNSEVVTDVETAINEILRREHNLEVDEDDDFSVTNQQSLLDTATAITDIFTVLLGAIAGISLLVGGIGIMNIMLVSVTERTKEIGLRKAIGARRSHILQQFLIETVVLSVLGGLVGVLLGILIALAVNNSGLLSTSITWDSIALGIGFSSLVGLFFGVYPANRAASLEPIEALRYE